jgi:hypothetical protein
VATATVGVLIAVAAAVQLSQPPVSTVVKDNPPGGPSWQIPFAQTRQVLIDQETDLRNMHLSTSTSPVDAALQQNLQQVKQFIADCERHLKADPQDDLAREYLADAYQQEAELLAAMMDRGRSVN